MEESVSTQWADRITTIKREDEVLVQFCATQDKFSKQRMDRKHITTQQENYNTGLYETSHWEERVSSQWVDRIKTSSREDEVLAKSSATKEKFSKQRMDRTHITNQQEK